MDSRQLPGALKAAILIRSMGERHAGALLNRMTAEERELITRQINQIGPLSPELVDKVARVHGPNHSELAQVRELFHKLRAGMEPHLRTEETMLFPEISLSAGRPDRPLSDEVRNELEENQQEHDNAGHLLAELRELTGGYAVPADACASFKSVRSARNPPSAVRSRYPSAHAMPATCSSRLPGWSVSGLPGFN